MINTIADNGTIKLGFVNDNDATVIQFPIANTISIFGNGGNWLLLNRRPSDDEGYPVPLEQVQTDDSFLYWTVSSYDVAENGNGECQLMYSTNGTVKMSQKWRTAISSSIISDGTVPEPMESWLADLAEYAETASASADAASEAAETANDLKNGAAAEADRASEAADRAVAATVYVPFIGENGNWYIYSQDAGQYIDTGFSARPSFVVVSALPAEGADGVIYLVPNGGTGSNLYDEYVYIGRWEMIGTTEIDLSGYATKPVTSGQIGSGAVTNDKVALTKLNLGSNINYTGNKGIAAGGSTNAITYWTPGSVAAVATIWRYNGNVFMSTHSNNSATPPEAINLDSSFYEDWVPALLFTSVSGGGLLGNGAVTGSNSLSVGQGCAVLANQSAAIGARNAVTHSNVFVGGVGLLSGSGAQVIFGSWNVKTAGRMIIGAGSSDNRRNDLLFDTNGNLHIRGKVYQEATNPDGTGGTEVGGKVYLHTITITGSGSWGELNVIGTLYRSTATPLTSLNDIKGILMPAMGNVQDPISEADTFIYSMLAVASNELQISGYNADYGSGTIDTITGSLTVADTVKEM